MKSVLEDDRIRNVILSYRIHAHLYGGHRDVDPGFPYDRTDSERRSTWSAYMRALQALVGAGKNVVLVLQAPELPTSMESLIYRSPRGDELIPSMERDWWAERTAYVRQRLGDIPADVITIDPTDRFCDGTSCFAARGGTSYYFDDNHMSVAGAAIIARQILVRLGLGPPEEEPATVMRGGAGGGPTQAEGSLEPPQPFGQQGEEAVGVDLVDDGGVGGLAAAPRPVDHRAPQGVPALGLDHDVAVAAGEQPRAQQVGHHAGIVHRRRLRLVWS
jgi:hypothetical protein